jgi:predicted RNA-binding Zn-ribbon protein involved in translation (DUF1610 family)
MEPTPGTLTPQQAQAAASSLLMRTAQEAGQMLACPACGTSSIPQRLRSRLHPFASIECPACQTRLRLKGGRLLCLGVLALFAALLLDQSGAVAGLTRLPAATVAPLSVFLAVTFYAIGRRLPLIAAP